MLTQCLRKSSEKKFSITIKHLLFERSTFWSTGARIEKVITASDSWTPLTYCELSVESWTVLKLKIWPCGHRNFYGSNVMIEKVLQRYFELRSWSVLCSIQDFSNCENVIQIWKQSETYFSFPVYFGRLSALGNRNILPGRTSETAKVFWHIDSDTNSVVWENQFLTIS